MRNRDLPSSKYRRVPGTLPPTSGRGLFRKVIIAAAVIVFCTCLAAAFLHIGGYGYLVLENPDTGVCYARFRARIGDEFSVGFIHSVNKSPVTDFYEIRPDGIYVVRTVYYGFGAGVQTELNEGERLDYGEDGSMIISGINKKIEPLLYIVGSVSDHELTIRGGDVISLRDLCGKSALVHFSFHRLI